MCLNKLTYLLMKRERKSRKLYECNDWWPTSMRWRSTTATITRKCTLCPPCDNAPKDTKLTGATRNYCKWTVVSLPWRYQPNINRACRCHMSSWRPSSRWNSLMKSSNPDAQCFLLAQYSTRFVVSATSAESFVSISFVSVAGASDFSNVMSVWKVGYTSLHSICQNVYVSFQKPV